MDLVVRRPERTRPLRLSTSPFIAFLLFSFSFTLLWFEEYSIYEGLSRTFYGEAFGGFRWIDLFILGASWLVVTTRMAVRQLEPFRFPPPIRRAAYAFVVSVLVAVLYGWMTGGTKLFTDSRNLVLGILFALMLYNFAISEASRLRYAALALLTIISIKGMYVMTAFFIRPEKEMLFDRAIPVFDGPTLDSAVFVGVASISMALVSRRGSIIPARYIFIGVAGVELILVVLAFRRTFWGELAIAFFVMSCLIGRRRMVVVMGLLVIAASFLVFNDESSAFRLRLESTNPFVSDNPYTTTNQFHINDILDAWDHIKQSPVLGLGVGKPYETRRIAATKTKSWGVHNAPLHVWLRFGLLGLLSYFFFHMALFRWLFRLSRRLPSDSFERTWVIASLSYMVAVFTMGLSFRPWPYGELQNSLLLFSLIAIALRIDALNPVHEENRVQQQSHAFTVSNADNSSDG